jgi:hypothetical protein
VDGRTATISSSKPGFTREGSNPAPRRSAPWSALWQLHRSTGALIALEPEAIAEPLPVGVWIRPAQERPQVAAYRRWLHSTLADQIGHPGRFRVVIGYPGCSAIPCQTVAEYCDMIPDAVWPGVRFSRFGPVSRPVRPGCDSDPLGQTLADMLGRFVIVGTGVRVCGPAEPGGARERDLLPDGTMSSPPSAADFGFTPRNLTPQGSSDPRSVNATMPAPGLAQARPGAFAPGWGAELEVIESGLWIRPDQPTAQNAPIRGPRPEPLPAHSVENTPSTSAPGRMHNVAARLQRLAERTRAASRLLPAGSLEQDQTAAGPVPSVRPAASTPEVSEEVSGALGQTCPAQDSRPPVASEALEPPAAAEAVGAATDARPTQDPQLPAVASAELSRSPQFRLESELPTNLPYESRQPENAIPDARASVSGRLPDQSPKSAEPAAPAAAPGPATETGPQPADSLRVQCPPDSTACALPPSQGLDEERTWLRRSLADRYDAEAGLVSRLLSETPGLRGGAGEAAEHVVTDLVAVRLYLAGDSRALDDAVRSAKVGPHTPMARCITSGLRRLPSYRGATRLQADLGPDALKWYTDRRIVTEWSFCPALAGGQGRLPGATEVLIWSVTARRTALVDPNLPEQVIFLPGTRFSVLLVQDAARPRLLLREKAATEPDTAENLSALDELALRGLELASKAWTEPETAQRPLPPAAAGRFGNPPGLILPRPAPTAARIPAQRNAVPAGSRKDPTA